jgi:gluconolactonase
MDLELLAWGYGLVEGPRVDEDGVLYFSDAQKGGVYRRQPDGTIETLVPGRKLVGGLALHADGGFVMTGRDVLHWKDGESRTVLRDDAITHWNDLQPDAEGRIIVGSVRSDLFDPNGKREPGEAYRIGLDGKAVVLYGDVAVSNGIGFSPDGTTLYHSDSTSKGLWAHDVAADGSLSNRRHLGKAAFERGIPDGMCVDADGNLWVAHVGGRRVAKLDPGGALIGEVPVPAKAVTSVTFGGPELDELYIVTADNTDDEAKGGSIFRTKPGAQGQKTPLARV